MLVINKKLCYSNIFFAEGKTLTVLAHYEMAVTECTVVACHRAFGISTKEVKLCYWQNSLGRYQACDTRQTVG